MPSAAPPNLGDSAPTARSAIDGERRRVTVLFADLSGLTAQRDHDDVHETMNRCFAVITDAVQRLEGTINQYTDDGVMALFGASVALDDAPRRAVQAAVDIQRALRDYDRTMDATRGLRVQLRIGLHTGVVAVGHTGDDARIGYTAMGDTTTIAAQLQRVAEPGTVVVSGATRHLIADHFETADLGEHHIEGHRAPIHAFEVLRARPRRARLRAAAEHGLTPFVGRERELATLIDLFEHAKQGGGQVAFIDGDAGIGKSRLVYELRRELAVTGVDATWLEGRCASLGQATPLLPCVDQLREYFDIEEADDAEEISAKLEAGVERLGELNAHVPSFRYLLAIEGEAAVAAMDASVRRARLFEALRALALRAAQRRPTVLVFDDLQWIDSSSEVYLSSALDAFAAAPVLIIGTYRTGHAPPFERRSNVTALTLHGLSDTDTLAMVGRRLGAAECPPELRAVFTERAGGVPLRIEEMVAALVDLGVLQLHDGGFRVIKPSTEVDVPDTTEGLVAARLDRLGESAKRAVQAAAVIGRHVRKRLLERVTEVPAQLDGLLAELARREMVYEQPGAPEPAYVFKHAVIQDVAYNSLPLPRRKELHRAVGHAVEELFADRRVAHAAELAHHFSQGELWAKAMEYAALAGDRAADTYANAEAAAHYAHALDAAELLPSPAWGELSALHVKRGGILNRLGKYDEGIAHFERALALVRAHGDRRAEVEALLGLADLYYNYHRAEPAQRYCDEALALGTALGDAALQAACLASRASYISGWQGPIAEARSSARAALEYAQTVDSAPLRCRTLIFLGTLLQWRADFDACLPYLHEGAQLAERLHLGDLRGHALFHLGHAYLSTGRYDQALRWYGEMHHYAESANDKFWLVRAPNVVGGVHLELFDLDAAIELCREGDEMTQRLSPSPESRGHCLVKLGLAYLARGEHGAADESLRTATELLEQDSWARWRWHMPLLRARAELALATGRIDEASSYASQSHDLAVQTDSRKHVAHSKLVLGQIALAQDRFPEAEKLLRSAVTLADHIHTARELWMSGSALGDTLARMGRDRDAEAFLTQAAQTIEAIAAEVPDPVLRASFTSALPVAEVYRRLGRRPQPAKHKASSAANRG